MSSPSTPFGTEAPLTDDLVKLLADLGFPNAKAMFVLAEKQDAGSQEVPWVIHARHNPLADDTELSKALPLNALVVSSAPQVLSAAAASTAAVQRCTIIGGKRVCYYV